MPPKETLFAIFPGQPPAPEHYEPALWLHIMSVVPFGGKKNGVTEAFRREFYRFASRIKDTRPFMLDTPVIVGNDLDRESILNAAAPFQVTWWESRTGELFTYPDGGLKDPLGNPTRHAGLWLLQETGSKNTALYATSGDDHFMIVIFPPAEPFMASNKILMAALEPYLHSRNYTLPVTAGPRAMHKKIRGHVAHINPITIINAESSLAVVAYDPETRRIYLHSWDVRGFWRRLNSEEKLGYNLDGEQVVPGKTWVKSHIRGGNKPKLQKKWRVMTPDSPRR